MVAFTFLLSILLAGTAALATPTKRSSTLTPHGQRDASKMHEVPQGGEVRIADNEIHLLDASGNVVHVAENDADTVKPYPSGWTAYAQWINSASGASPINFFNTTWSVPPAPASNDDQTVFLFNSLVPTASGAILQPVVQWGGSAAGGGAYWSVASWYLVGSSTYYTTLIDVNAGDVLEGVLSLTSTDGTNYDYVSSFSNIEGTSITATNSVELTWATETLECYGITQISDYPAGETVFSGIYITTQAGVPSMSWDAISDSADGIITTVNADGPTNAQVTITY